MNNTFSIYLFLIGLICFGCNSLNQNKIQKLSIKSEFKFKIDLDSAMGFSGINNFHQPKKSDFIYFLNKESKTLFVLDLKCGKLNKKSVFQCDFEIDEFCINQECTEIIFINEGWLHEYKLSGEFVQKIKVPLLKNGYLFTFSNDFELIKEDETYSFNFFPNINKTYKSEQFYQKPISCIWDLKKHSVHTLPIFYPSNYQNACHGTNFLSSRISVGYGRHLYSFHYNDTAVFYDVKSKKRLKFNLGSRTKKSFSSIPFNDLSKYNAIIFDKLINENPCYLNVRYFSQNNLFIRTYYPNKGESMRFKKWIHVLFDEQFNYLGESELIQDFSLLFDSSYGVLSLQVEQNQLICSKVSFI
jgi:hypothetical protein